MPISSAWCCRSRKSASGAGASAPGSWDIRFWIADPQEGVNNVRSEVNRAIWREFRSHGITIPVSQHDVRMVAPHGNEP